MGMEGLSRYFIAAVLAMSMSIYCLWGQGDSTAFNGGKPLVMETSVVSSRAVRSSQDGDTLSYNAAAYKVILGSDAEAMISKMPGISVTGQGIEALGKEVRRIMIDGQEFFGDNVLTALRNIPADMIQQVEVINKMSDLAELTGVDDGNSYTAINIITRPEAREGALTGRLYGGYGLPDRYIAGGSLNYFDKERMASVIGMSNNISKYNFTSDDLVGASSGSDNAAGSKFRVKSLPGLSDVHSAGANYGNRWFSGSYFFNCIDNRNESENLKQTILDGDKVQLTDSRSDFAARNYSHVFESKISLAPSPSHRLIFRPTVSIQDLANSRNDLSGFAQRVAGGEDSFIRNRLTGSSNDRFALKAGGNLSYVYKFEKKGRNLSMSASGTYNGSSQDEESGQYTFRDPDTETIPEMADSHSAQIRDRNTVQSVAGATLSYREPLGKNSYAGIEYRFNWNSSRGTNLTYLWDEKEQEYSGEPDSRQSSLNRSVFIRNTANLRYQYIFRKISVTANAGYENLIFNGSAQMPYEYDSAREFHNAVYSLTANLPFNRQNTLRINARGRTVNPSVNMLQDVVNLNNMSNIRAGNPEIEPAYLHEVGIRYIHTDKKSGSTLSMSVDFTGSGNYFCDSLVIDSPDFIVSEGITLGEGNQYVKPINIDGYYRIYGKVTYGFPVDFIRSNMNINSAVSVSSLPGMINADRVPVHRNWYSAGIRTDSNVSENLDFSLSYSGKFVQNEYSGRFGKVTNNFYAHEAHADLKWIFWKGFSFSGSATFRQDISTDGRFNDRYIFCDLFVGKRLFRNRMGEISIGVNDLFNDGVMRYGHSVSASGTNDSSSIGIGRYFSVQFIWHIRHYRYREDL